MILIYIVIGVRIYREQLARSLDARNEVRVVGCAATAAEAAGQIVDLGPDVVVVDTSAPDGIADARRLGEVAIAARLVGLAAQEDDRAVIACVEAGVAAFVARDGTLDELVAAAQAVVRGETACTPRIAAALLRHVADRGRDGLDGLDRLDGEFPPLTSRERQVVALIDEGLSNKEIAARLCIELSTVKNHVHNLLEKLGARGRSEAAARVRMAGRAPAAASSS